MDVIFHSMDASVTWLCRVLDLYTRSKGLRFAPRFGWTSEHEAWELVRDVESARLVLIWKGDEPGGRWLERICRTRGRPCLFVDAGLLPEEGYFHFDPGGVLGRSSLCGDLGWVTREHRDRYAAHREAQFRQHEWTYRGTPDGPVVVLLQDESASAMSLHSPISTNSELIRLAEQRYADRDIVVVPPPGFYDWETQSARARVEAGALTDLARDAGLVFGLNAPVLLQAAMFGIPTVAVAPCPLQYHAGSVDTLLAACTSRQIPWDTTLLDPWLEALGVSL